MPKGEIEGIYDIGYPLTIDKTQLPGRSSRKEIGDIGITHVSLWDIRGNESNKEGWKAYLAYISEGIGRSQDWEMFMKYQKKNGSLFNSTSTTAAAFTSLNNAGCLSYLRSLIEKFGNTVPTIYPPENYARLSMISSLESMGVDRHFWEEIRTVLAR